MSWAKYRTICFPKAKRLLKVVMAVFLQVQQTAKMNLSSAWMGKPSNRFMSHVVVSSMRLSLWWDWPEFGGKKRTSHD
jgi:hypothetical protein